MTGGMMDQSRVGDESKARLTGYLGGAVASQVRIKHPLFGYTLFPVYIAVLLWGGLYLRDSRLRAPIPTRSNP